MRPDGRKPDELREIAFERDYTDMTPGSVLVTTLDPLTHARAVQPTSNLLRPRITSNGLVPG